jgi:hypothetical protein
MKKYLLFLTSLSLLVIFGLASFVKAVKSDTKMVKKVTQTVNPTFTSILNRQLLASELEKNLAPKATEKLDRASREELMQNMSELPLIFEKNMGQWRKEILYRATAQGTKVALRKNGVTFLTFREMEEHDEDDPEEEDDSEEEEMYERMVWNLNFKGMNSGTEVIAEGETPGVTNYLLGNDSTKWVKNAPQSRLINYKEIFDHIDLHYYGLENHKLEYDYIVKPGGNITNIQMELDGAGGLRISEKGELIITTPWGKVAEDKPVSYQYINGVKKEVDIRYQILNDSTFGFKAYGSYNANYDLVIDPKVLIWSSFAKGTSLTHYVQDIGIDANRNVYVSGWTVDGYDITSSVVQNTFAGSEDAFVSKFNRKGTQLLYSTYVGGSAQERAYSIAVNSAGNAYLSGRTDSGDYPTQAAIYAAPRGGTDIFISALNPAGSTFVYSTYFGGSSGDKGGTGLFVNAASQLFVTGMGKGSSFPTTAGVLRTAAMTDGSVDAFVLKLSAAGANLLCTFLGGSGTDEGYGVFESAAGDIYVSGETDGGFPVTAGSYDNSANGGFDAFVVKLNATATALTYSTYLGGGGADTGYGIYVKNNEAYVSGTAESGFPTTAGAYQTANKGSSDFFVTKFNTAGSALVYSTFLGGGAIEGAYLAEGVSATDVLVNNNGEAYLSGISSSTDYPVINGAYMSASGGDDGVLSLLSANGGSLLCSTYLGGSSNDYKKLGIAIDLTGAKDTLYASITSHSPDFPIVQTQGAVYGPTKVNAGDDQPVVMKILSCSVPLPVELISFKGSNQGDHNLLEWFTATEKNNDYFSVERSTDGVNFLAIGIVDGAGNSNSLLNYSYSDPKEGEEITYYRLKQTDFNGQISYSDVVAINAARTNEALQLTINSPVTDHLNYKVCCVHKGNAQVEVIDLSGRIVISLTVHVNEGYNKLTLDSKVLAEGLYILKFTTANGTVNVKFVK